MKKIFASDLDQTLIYSTKFFSLLSEEEKEKVCLIEQKDNAPISYISIKTVNRIREMMKSTMFIPTTTRTIEQYKRIALFQKELAPKYAVVSNGGNIIVNGEIDLNWSEYINSKIKTECISGEEVLAKFEEIKNSEWTSDYRKADNLFYYFIIKKENYPTDKMIVFEKWLKENGWMLSVQKNKMYMIPEFIDKWNAVKKIAEIEKINSISAAGDSKLDWNMIFNADRGVIPAHAAELEEIYDNKHKKIVFTKTRGIFSSEEILEIVVN